MGKARSHKTVTFPARHLDLTDLRIHAEKLIHIANRSHTRKVYDRVWEIFNKHLELYEKDLQDIKELDIIEFIAFLSLGQLAQVTIATYISGVCHHLRLRNLPTFEDNFMLKLVLKGVSNLHVQVDVRLPILLDILQCMIGALSLLAANPYNVALYTPVLSAGFFGLLCPEEIVHSEHALLASKVYISSTKVVCLLPMSKAHKGPVPQSIHLYKQPNLACPVTAFTNYSKIRSSQGGQYFIKVDGTPITNLDLTNILCHLSQFLNLPHHHFKPHSLRIGGSTHLHLSGVLVHKIKEIGQWSSDVFKKYIHV